MTPTTDSTNRPRKPPTRLTCLTWLSQKNARPPGTFQDRVQIRAVTQLIRGGENLVTIAEIAGHSRLETLRIYSQPTDDDKHHALRHLTIDH
ncbi:MAG: hypothetical protein DLM60_02120 [Pseudonocardiales bacterium]|nr:MAG: hypothetical protein DLM60_02120 [Pseudonocardiales bacterium]